MIDRHQLDRILLRHPLEVLSSFIWILTPGLPGISSTLSLGASGSNTSLWPCGTFSGAKCTISSTAFL